MPFLLHWPIQGGDARLSSVTISLTFHAAFTCFRKKIDQVLSDIPTSEVGPRLRNPGSATVLYNSLLMTVLAFYGEKAVLYYPDRVETLS